MNTTDIKNYAPQARKDFIAAVTKRAALYGVTEQGSEAIEVKGDVALIAGRPFPVSIVASRKALVAKVNSIGFQYAMEQAAYSWFNRLCAIRYMELHGYLDHGRRVLSHPQLDQGFEIVDDCLQIDLPGLDKNKVQELKLHGDQDEELFRELLLAQCHALHKAMPFLFESIDDFTELLLPDNLTKTDSLIRSLVDKIPEHDWQDVEIIGWLYQFYISEKKDEVIGKVVKSQDIPAATQLFTPNWIVKYMVQNSLGAQWLATYPQSPLKAQMEYYIEPAEQTDEVNAQLAAITPSQLNPEELTLIDPACGSGHILVEAYELFKAIYLERGYRLRDIPMLILEKNLFGLDIDQRAAQLSGFALMMNGRADDRRLFERGVMLNVMALVDSGGFDAEGFAQSEEVRVALSECGLRPGEVTELARLFEHATTFGSLIQVPEELAQRLPALKHLSEATSQDIFVTEALTRLVPLVQQAELLAARYDSVVANPPYMGGRGMYAPVKSFAAAQFPAAKGDLFACFIERGYTLAKNVGQQAMVTMQSWMFLSSFEQLREGMLRCKTISSMAHLGARAFGSISGEVVQTTMFVIRNNPIQGFKPVFIGLLDGGEQEKLKALVQGQERYTETTQEDFRAIPGSTLAYWLSDRFRRVFNTSSCLESVAKPRQGLATSDNDRFLRQWFEPAGERVAYGVRTRPEALESGMKWFPCLKGGGYRKWYGNHDFVVNWEDDGRELLEYAASLYGSPTRTIKNISFYFRGGVSWSDITSSQPSFRSHGEGFIFNNKANCIFFDDSVTKNAVLSFVNSSLFASILHAVNPTLTLSVGTLQVLPAPPEDAYKGSAVVDYCVSITKRDWDAYERSWDFQSSPIMTATSKSVQTLECSFTAWTSENRKTIAEMKRFEEENNRLFIDAYDLAEEITPDVPIEQITLTVNPAYRYGIKSTEEERDARFRQDTMQELVSYAIGCMMGRYSLDEPGLIYARSGSEGFDPSRYVSFPADDDGIIPLTSSHWFDDDACQRVVDFISIVWPIESLEANLSFLADNLAPKNGESSRATLRRYLCDKFFKDHLKTYKKRPIYWLFSSGKEKAFQCLVYLHRYNAGTLARMRTDYVIPLTSKLAAHEAKLQLDKDNSESTPEIKGIEKQLASLTKQQVELNQFDEKLKHYADQNIEIDLDDGVKVNYGKFGSLLAEVKAITGSKPVEIS